MPRPGPRRAAVAVRMSPAGIQALDALTTPTVSRSEVVRLLLAAALADRQLVARVRRQVSERAVHSG